MASALHVNPECPQSLEMGVQSAAADHIAPRRRQGHPPQPGRHWPGEQDRGPNLPAQFRIQFTAAQSLGTKRDRMVAKLDLHAEPGEKLEHGADILNEGNVLQGHRLVGQHTGSEHRQDGIFVAARDIDPAQPLPAMYDESSHSP